MGKRFNATLGLLAIMMILLSLMSCTEETALTDDGKVAVTLDFSFEPQGNALETRGISGNLDFGIDNLVILFYDGEDETEEVFPLHAFEYDNSNGTGFDVYEEEKRESTNEEEKTWHGMVTINGIEPGSYRIYAVANVDIADKNISEKELREIQINWTQPNISDNEGTPSKYGVPNAMFGYFTDDVIDHTQKKYRNVIHHNLNLYKKEKESDKGDDHTDVNRAKPVTLDKTHMQVQAWLKRVVSKLTIGFDGSGLYEGVEIYIKSARIVDAAATCLLGHDNSVGYPNRDYNNTSKTIELLDNNTTDPRLYTIYSEEEGAKGVKISKDTPAFPRQNEDDNIQTKNGDVWNSKWYNYVHGTINTPPTYGNTLTTLYFMENLQGVATEENAKGHKEDPTDNNYTKDGKPNGTYIEVEAYYKNSVSHGDIIYRFMLGKNITNDFNVERNFHYRLTLSFVGNANNVDWHIEYDPKLDYGACPWDKADDVNIPEFE